MLRSLDVSAAGTLTALMAVLCLGTALATIAVVGGALGLPLGLACAVATFQLLRVPVGRAASRLLDR